MLIRQLIGIRERYHPLHKLRRSRYIARRLMPLFDRRMFVSMHGVGWPVRVRRMRHATYVLDNRLMEPGLVAVVRIVQSLAVPRVFWDVGANVGFYSWLTMSADPRLRAVLFEPDPDNILLLRETIALSGLDRVTLVTRAASAEAGVSGFVVDAEIGSRGRLGSGQPGAPRDVMTVETTTLDAELVRHPAPDLIKIDVEGMETMVLAGAQRVIDEVRPIVVIECFDGPGARSLRRLADAGYTLVNADDPRLSPGDTANYLCLPPDASFGQAEIVARFEQEYDRWVAGA